MDFGQVQTYHNDPQQMIPPNTSAVGFPLFLRSPRTDPCTLFGVAFLDLIAGQADGFEEALDRLVSGASARGPLRSSVRSGWLHRAGHRRPMSGGAVPENARAVNRTRAPASLRPSVTRRLQGRRPRAPASRREFPRTAVRAGTQPLDRPTPAFRATPKRNPSPFSRGEGREGVCCYFPLAPHQGVARELATRRIPNPPPCIPGGGGIPMGDGAIAK